MPTLERRAKSTAQYNYESAVCRAMLRSCSMMGSWFAAISAFTSFSSDAIASTFCSTAIGSAARRPSARSRAEAPLQISQ